MDPLLYIIWGSIFLAVASILGMIGLIFYRDFHDRQKRRDEARMVKLSQMALKYMETPERMPEFKAQLKADDRRPLLQSFFKLLPRVQGEYADRIIRMMRDLGVVEEAMSRSQARAWWHRAEACAILGHFKEPPIVQLLEARLDDPQIEVRLEAARALVKMKANLPVGNLLAKLAADNKNPSLAVTDLFRSLGVDAVPELIAVLESDATDVVKLMAIDALGYLGDLRAVDALPPFHLNPSPELRLAAMKTLSLLGDPRSMLFIQDGLMDPVPTVRAQSAFCAGQMAAVEFVPALISLLNDRHWGVRYHAAEALFKLGDAGKQALLEAATHPDTLGADIARGLLREKLLVP